MLQSITGKIQSPNWPVTCWVWR